VALVSARGEASAPIPVHNAFWLKPISIFGSFFPNDVYQQFTSVSLTIPP